MMVQSKTKKPNATDILVGQRIRQRRLLLGISQTELGGSVGVTFQEIQKYEKGINRISIGRLVEIAETLKTDVGALMDRDGRVANGQPDPAWLIAFCASRQGLAIAEAFQKISDKATKIDIVRMVELIAKVSK